MKLKLIAFLFLILFNKILFAQCNYIIVIDRINNTQTFKQKDFKNGRPFEKEIKKPEVKKGDIVTVRMVNFNELIYGLHMQTNLIEKPKNIVSEVLEASGGIMRNYSMTPALGQLTELLKNPPLITRGGSSVNSAATIHSRLIKFYQGINQTESSINDLLVDEGLVLDEMKSKANEIDVTFNSIPLINEFKKIKNDIAKFYDSSDSEWATLINSIQEYNEDNIVLLSKRIKDLKRLLKEIDFVSESTFVVEGRVNGFSSREIIYEKFNVKANIYKRVTPITLRTLEETKKQYKQDISDNSDDQINQSFDLDLKVKSKYVPYFGISINRIFVPNNRYSYSIEPNGINDSIQFKTTSVGASKTSIGLALNFDIPIKSQFISFTGNFGYSMAFWNSTLSNDEENSTTQKKGYVTTGISLGHRKFKYINLSLGAAWSEFEQLSSKYQADKFFENNLSDAEKVAAITKKIKPAFYIGLNINL
jgi:hypothetical protein